MRDMLELMGKLNEESKAQTGTGSAKPVTRNRLERTKSLKSWAQVYHVSVVVCEKDLWFKWKMNFKAYLKYVF